MDLSSLTRDQTHAPCIESAVLTTGLAGKSQKSIFLQTRTGGYGKAFVSGRVPQGPAQFNRYHK